MIGFLLKHRQKRDMLHLGNKILLFSLIFLLASCYNEQEKLRERTYNKSVSIVGVKEYYTVYNNMKDSIDSWGKNGLNYYKYFGNSLNCEVDSLICFNEKKDKAIAAILLQDYDENGSQDDIWYFYGAKVNGEWLFFDGGDITLIRKRYQRDIHKPIPFDKMKDLAMKYIYSSYLKKNENHEWVVNDRFFNGFAPKNQVSTGYGSCFECETEDQYFLYLVRRNWEKKEE